jgi:hypothetical protein
MCVDSTVTWGIAGRAGATHFTQLHLRPDPSRSDATLHAHYWILRYNTCFSGAAGKGRFDDPVLVSVKICRDGGTTQHFADGAVSGLQVSLAYPR